MGPSGPENHASRLGYIFPAASEARHGDLRDRQRPNVEILVHLGANQTNRASDSWGRVTLQMMFVSRRYRIICRVALGFMYARSIDLGTDEGRTLEPGNNAARAGRRSAIDVLTEARSASLGVCPRQVSGRWTG